MKSFNYQILNNKRLLIFAISSLLNYTCFCQVEKYSEMIANIAEELAAEDNDPEAAETYVEYLNELTENPVMINSTLS